MIYYLNGTAVRMYAQPSSKMTVFYLDGTATVLQEYSPAVAGTLFFSNWW